MEGNGVEVVAAVFGVKRRQNFTQLFLPLPEA